MTVTVSTHPSVPGGFLLTAADGRTAISTLDHEFPALAATFGWDATTVQSEPAKFRCRHAGTDGSIDCPDCGCTATDFGDIAATWLRYKSPLAAADPGYFD